MESEPNIGGSNNGLEKVLSSSPEPVEIPSPTSHHGNAPRHARTLSSSSSSSRLTERPPPFSRKLTRALFIRPAETRGLAPGHLESIKSALTYSWVNVLFVFNPIAWALHYTHQTDGAVFAMALLGVIPLAGMLGHGTETIALYTGDALGGLINASLGNATEFIIAILLLVKCEIRVVQASLLGGLLSNLLLVTGMAFIVGGVRFSQQQFQQTAAQLNTSLLTLAVIALVIPTCFAFAIEQASGEETERDVILEMSRGSALILIFIYASYMVFQLYSHSYLYNPDNDILNDASSVRSAPAASVQPPMLLVHDHELAPPPVRRTQSLVSTFGSRAFLGQASKRGSLPAQCSRVDEKDEEKRQRDRQRRQDPEAAGMAREDTSSEKELETPEMNLTVAISVLIAATGLTYLTAEALTDSLEGIGQTGSVSTEWLGLILLAIVGNAAEHVTAVFVAYRNKIDLALAVSVGSCIQISLFVIPLLVLIGWIANKPLSLLFDPLEVVTLFLSVLLVRFATEDGRTHYMSGILLFGTYVLIAFSFWFYPQNGTSAGNLFAEC
ncbi:Sodium/calcium exchanger protein-domain-containing protein [Armillaria luteobubalina]|uniref:Sodium/calcium exchanger protein-domain-containing protein n=1 Tax=Armillaria luteobubalina TaxID=153913 RepID=A0AA39UX16_9AGAR|nr:Sodium/calcium exchanger protein-domain-containing protein [Armillaria luteobubalina]